MRIYLEIAVLRGRMRRVITRAPADVLDNLRVAFGSQGHPAGIERLARCHVEFMARLQLMRKLLEFPSLHESGLWPVRGLESLEEALAENRGVILLSAHYGYPRLIAPILKTHGYDVKTVVSGVGNRKVKKVECHEIVATLDVRPIFTELSKGRPVVMLGDGMRALEFTKLSLLGREYPFPTGFMKIAAISEAPVLPIFAIDGPRGNRITLEIHPSLRAGTTNDITANLRAYAQTLERQLLCTPHLWHRWSVKDFFSKALRWSDSSPNDRFEKRWKG